MSDIFDDELPIPETLEVSEELPAAIPEEVQESEAEVTPDELAEFLWDTTKKFEDEDEEAHRKFFNQAILGEFYWSNKQHVYKDFLGSSPELYRYKAEDDDESDLYTANVYRPNGESIIAAMAIDLPQVNFYPDDADVADDVTTANAYARIATLVQKHNKAHTLITRALQILYNQSFVAFYNYNRKSPKYGTYKKPRFEEVSQTKTLPVCPQCDSEVLDTTPPITCENCGYTFESPATRSETETFPTVVGYTEEPKARECIHAFGPLHVKCAPYIQTQEDTPYIILKFERHPSIGKYQYPKYKDEINRRSYTSTSEYERQYRAELFEGDYDHLDTWVCVWLRPAVYEMLEDDDKIRQHLLTNYPKGAAITFINGVMVDIRDEDMDDHWTICENPLGTFINSQPIGKASIPLQDATNELVNLSMDTIKHGIPQTFITSDLINFAAYKQMEVKPGMAIPANSLPAGRSINDLITTTRTATLSQEVDNVYDKLMQLSQLTTGAFPSIYGGVVQGSRTASEYAQSRAQALQRLSLTWTMLKQVWADVMGKACVSFANNMEVDEKDVIKDGSSYINMWIRRAELTGKVGKVEPEVDEQLPTSWAQQRDVIMRLIEMNSPMINELLMHPTNAYTVKNAMGFKEIEIPGYKDKIKQLMEIDELLKSQPIGEQPSVMVDEQLDNHNIEAEVCREFLISEQGLMLKNINPPAYQNVYLHFLQHRQVEQMRAAAMMQQEAAQQPQQENPNA